MKRKKESLSSQSSILSLAQGWDSHQIQEILLERSKQAALALGLELLEQDVHSLCGAPFSRKKEGLLHRGGSEKASIILDGAKIPLRKPRVRNDQGEVDLPTWTKLHDQDLFDRRIAQRMLRGITTRNYEDVVTAYSDQLGISKSNVSRAFVRASQKSLDALNHGDLTGHPFVALFIDGVELLQKTLIVAVGVTPDFEKIPLGVKEGDTENSVVVKDLISDLKERGFSLHCDYLLAVIDGSKALRKALVAHFGEQVIIQRCYLHKLRNLKKYIPQRHWPALLHWMKKIMGLAQFAEALQEMKKFEAWLGEISYEAKNSLLEAGEDLLTLHRLGLSGSVRKSFITNNVIESMMSVIRTKTYQVKNWNGSTTQRLRWVASAILAHQKKMRKIRGVKRRKELIEALNAVDLKVVNA